MQSVYFKFLNHFYGELMHTNHNSVCLNNIDLIIIFDFKMDFIVYAFILIYLPKYILHSVDIYDLGNSLLHTTLCRIPIENLYVSVVQI